MTHLPDTTQPWLILTRRYGRDVLRPPPTDLADALTELYVENLPGMMPGDYEEHGAVSLRYGFDEGPMYVLEVSRLGTVSFEGWADQDFEAPLFQPRLMTSVSLPRALQLLQWLAEGAIDSVSRQIWQ